MKLTRVLLVALGAVTLSGCLGLPARAPAPAPSPVVDSRERQYERDSTAQTPERTERLEVSAYQPPSAVRVAPVHGKAVTGLLATASQHQAAGAYPAAVATLERALRIEPRSAHLWHRLADVRMQQGSHALAVDLAGKSTALAGSDMALKRSNWGIVAKAKRAQGDVAGARLAEQRSRTLY